MNARFSSTAKIAVALIPDSKIVASHVGALAASPDLLLATDGVPVKDIVERVAVSKPTVIDGKKRHVAESIGGLEDRPKAGRRPVVVADAMRADGNEHSVMR